MLAALVRLLRPSHWAKNVFVLAPLVFAERLADPRAIALALAAFACFCAASSAVYVFNDIRDREEDRRHPLKRARPLAAGTVGVGAAAAVSVALALGAAAGAAALGVPFAAILLGYLALNFAYTLWLKHLVILDVMALALGFLLRVLGGGAAIRVEVSAWLLLCTIFVALFLAFSKRRHELMLLNETASEQRRVLSHYSAGFLDQMINVVTASTVLAYALYSVSAENLGPEQSRYMVYTVPFVLFGVFRYLYLIYQKTSLANPTEALVADAPFVVNLMLWGAVVIGIFYLL